MPRYKYTQESGADFKVVDPDKADGQEDTNQVRQVLDDLGNLLNHSKRDDLYPKDGTTGGYLGRLNYGLDASKPAVPVVNDMYLATDTVKVYRCFVAGNWVQVYPGTIENNVIKTGDFTVGKIAKINNATGIIEQGTNTDTDVADAVTKKHTQGTDYSNIVICANYDNPDDAITAIGADNKTLLVTEVEICDVNFTVPSNVKVLFERGGKWTINNGITVTFNGDLEAGLWQIFNYVGTGTLAGTPKISRIYPQWFGALGDGSNDDTAAITNAIGFLPTLGGTVFFPTGNYKITSAITMNKRGMLLGCTGLEDETANPPVTILKTGDFTGLIITSFSVIIDGIVVRGDTGNGGDGIQIKGSRGVLQNVSSVSNGGVGIRIGDDAEAVNCNLWKLINVTARDNTSHGVLIDDVASVNANGGLANGLSCYGNGGDGLKVARAEVNNFHGVVCEGNTGVGIRVTADGKNNTFWNPHCEGNTSAQFVFDASSSNNLVVGSMNYTLTDNGTNTVIKNTGGSSQQLQVTKPIATSSIIFPATQVPSANANTLDDYEEGEWTPALKFGGNSVGMTYSVQAGLYTKIGRQVTCTGRITLTAKGSSTGAAQITALPFTSKNADGAFTAVALKFDNISFADMYQGVMSKNTNFIVLQESTVAGVVTALDDTNFSDTSRITLSITYFTD